MEHVVLIYPIISILETVDKNSNNLVFLNANKSCIISKELIEISENYVHKHNTARKPEKFYDKKKTIRTTQFTIVIRTLFENNNAIIYISNNMFSKCFFYEIFPFRKKEEKLFEKYNK